METLNDYLPTTPDLHAERLADLRRLWPDLFTHEGQPDPVAVQAALGLGTPAAERYAFTWSGKAATRQAAFAPTTATLVPDEARSFQPELGRHAIIEGDNLQVLKLLLSGYRGRVKCIYIDPPYNTGKDFVYSDNYTEAKRPYWEQTGGLEHGVRTDTNPDTHGRYHSDWLSMMYGRLLLARQLLREDGVLFVSIDDNEVHNLRKVLDEVFGEENLVASIAWQSRQSVQNDTDFSVNHEYILAYAKNRRLKDRRLKPKNKAHWHHENDFVVFPLPLDKAKFSNPDNDPRGLWKADPFDAPGIRANLSYAIINPSTGKKVFPPEGRHWATEEKNFQKLLADNRILFSKDGDGKPQQKVFFAEKEPYGSIDTTWFDGQKAGTATKGTQVLQKVLNAKGIFDTPKPPQLIKHLLKLSTSKDSIVLDFFAGSGSTFQAVCELNEETQGARACILVQLPQQNDLKQAAYKAGYRTISDVTIARAKRVVAGYGDHPRPLATGFRVWRLEASRFPAARFQPQAGQPGEEQVAALKKYLAAKQATLQLPFADDDQVARVAELLLKNGFTLNYTLSVPLPDYLGNRVVRVTDQETNATALLSLDDMLTDATVQQLSHQPPAERFIAPERAFNTTAKWNLKMHLKDNLRAT